MFSSQLYPPVNKKRGVQKKFLLASLADCTPHFQIPGAALDQTEVITENRKFIPQYWTSWTETSTVRPLVY